MQLDIHVVMENHRAIIDAIQAHDADRASQLARHHVEGGRARLLESLRQAATERSEATAA
jgi:DNA-binding GntR family transcriptional regulator